jgi:hypothetical protein
MRRTTIALLAAALLLAGGALGCSKSQDEIARDCQAALSEKATKTNRPAECEGLSQDDYDTLLMAWVLKKGLADMPQEDRDMLDYYDDGSINDSIG